MVYYLIGFLRIVFNREKHNSYLFCSMVAKTSIFLIGFICSLGLSSPAETKDDYTFAFYKIDNKVEIIVNDSLIYSTEEMKGNPDLEGKLTYSIGHLLTEGRDEVIVRLYNGYAPYPEEKKDQHWEIEYSILKNGQEYDLMWDEGNDYKTGLVFEEVYYF